MNLIIKLDPSQPRVEVGQNVKIYSEANLVGCATVQKVNDDKCALGVFLDDGYEIKQDSFSYEQSESKANDLILIEGFQYYLGAEKNK